MNVHKNARMTVHGRLLLVQRVREADWRVVDAAAAAGVSERTAYTWLARYRDGGEPARHDRSSAPARSPSQLPDEVVPAPALERTAHRPRARPPGLDRRHRAAPPRPRSAERPRGAAASSPLRARRGRRAAPPRQQEARPDRRPGPPHHRRSARPPGARGRLGIPARRDRRCLRLADTELLPDERGATCAGFLTRGAAWFAGLGVRIERVMTDNAFAYTQSRAFQAAITDLGARCCQSNANQSPKQPKSRRSGRQLTPLGQGDRTVLLEDVAAVEVAVLMKVIMD
jgi:hypothetical protein